MSFIQLRTVTFTGVDERTDLKKLVALSRDYPGIEWGVLVSGSRTGIHNRYPSIKRMLELADLPIRKAAHLCGSLAEDVALGRGNPIAFARHLVRDAGRVQINLGQRLDEYPDLFNDMIMQGFKHSCSMIIQAYSFQSPSVQRWKGVGGSRHALWFHDCSGGRGIKGEFEPPVNRDTVGFGGGITPATVMDTLHEIQDLQMENECWIDIESGVRTENWLDLDRCEDVLKALGGFFSPVDTGGEW